MYKKQVEVPMVFRFLLMYIRNRIILSQFDGNIILSQIILCLTKNQKSWQKLETMF
jgi:hypothetical protein